MLKAARGFAAFFMDKKNRTSKQDAAFRIGCVRKPDALKVSA